MTTHYDVLGIAGDAPAEVIKHAYYERARLYHPDAHVSSSAAVRDEAERAMRTLNEAWAVLRSPTTRHRYDRRLQAEREKTRSSAGRPRGSRARRPTTATDLVDRPRVEIGAGFQYWLGSTAAMQRGSDGAVRFNLKVTGATLAPLRSLAPDGLVALHADDADIGDRELQHLLGMRGLRFLDLSGTPITDAGLVHLLGCSQLESLSLWNTGVTDDGVALVGRLTNLRQLGLGNTAVTDAGLRHLTGLAGLRLLQLWGTDVTGDGLAHLHRLRELEVVTLPWRVRGRPRRRLRAALTPGAIVA